MWYFLQNWMRGAHLHGFIIIITVSLCKDMCSCAHVHMYDWEIENSSLFPRHKLRTWGLMMRQKLIIASSEFHKNTGMGRNRHSDPQLAYYCFTFCSITNWQVWTRRWLSGQKPRGRKTNTSVWFNRRECHWCTRRGGSLCIPNTSSCLQPL